MSTLQKDFGGIIQAVYDPTSESLNVNIIGSGSPTLPNVVRLSDGVAYLTTTVAGSSRALDVNVIDQQQIGIFTKAYDAITATYPTSTQEIYQSRVGGSGGTVQETVTVNYTDATKNFITTVVRT